MFEILKRTARYSWIVVAAAFLNLAWIAAVRYWPGGGQPRRAPGSQAVYEDAAGPGVRIAQFYADKGELVRGESAIVCYGVRNAVAVRLEPPVESLKPSMNRCFAVSPQSTTTYTLTAEDGAGQARAASFTVSVKPPAPFISMLTQSHKEIRRGDAVTLCYSMKNAVKARLEPTHVPVAPAQNNCVRLYPKLDTEFTLTAYGEDGRTDTGKLTVFVK